MRLLKARWSIEANSGVTEEQRFAVCDWLRVHDVNPDDVRSVEVRGRRIYIVEYKRNDQGQRYVEHDEVVTRSYSVRLRHEPPVLELS